MKNYILYSSEGCHLCEQAYALCLPILAENINVVDILDDDKLVKLYGVHIPVLIRQDNQKALYWPFNSANIEALTKAE